MQKDRFKKLFSIACFCFLFTELGYSQYADIPDPFFERVLIEEEIDDKLDGKFLIENVRKIRFLDLKDRNISDLKGIEYFRNLVTLDCSQNNIESLDISKNKKLILLYCYENQLRRLNISRNKRLKIFWGGSNPLKTFDITKNPYLEQLDVSRTNIKNIDLSHNRDLKTLWIYNMPNLHSLDLVENVLLEEVYCYKNDNLKTISLGNLEDYLPDFFDLRYNAKLKCLELSKTIEVPDTWKIDDKKILDCNSVN